MQQLIGFAKGLGVETEDKKMSELTTMRVGGKARITLYPDRLSQLSKLIVFLKKNSIPYLVLGMGSNVVASDKGYDGAVIKTTRLNKLFVIGRTIIAECGCTGRQIANAARLHGLKGAEFLSTIPTTIGGAVVGNSGCFGFCVGDIVSKVGATNGKNKIFSKCDMKFCYRSSVMESNGYVVTKVILRLQRGNVSDVESVENTLKFLKQSSQPLNMASSGSVFKRGKDYSAAELIDKAGLKGYAIGNARVSEKHSGFIVNEGEATAEDVMQLTRYIEKTIFEIYNIRLDREVKFVGEFD